MTDIWDNSQTEVNLSQMLSRREARANEQHLLLAKYNAPLISFTMNIPGPVKTNSLIRKAFNNGKISLLSSLESMGAEVNALSEVHEDTGDELLLSVKNISPEILKTIAVKIESEHKAGRLFDIDVINADGEKLTRKNFRKCLICNHQAQECARSRIHTVREMQCAIEKLLMDL